MNKFELRWIVPPHTVEYQPILQYRIYDSEQFDCNLGDYGLWSDWTNVPFIVVNGLEFEKASKKARK